MTQRFQSHVALADNVKQDLVASLNVALATTIDLSYQVKQAHWNIKGPQFFARHELFDKLAQRLRGASDELAERAATLGGYAEGTVRLSAKMSKLPEYDLKASDGRAHIKALVDRYAVYAKTLREGIEDADEKGDPITADLYTEVARAAELDMWFLESHINV